MSLSVYVTALAGLLANGLSDGELDLAASAFTQLGDCLATLSAERALCESREEKENTA